jgi:hypothetical protein
MSERILPHTDQRRDALKTIYEGLKMALDGAFNWACLRLEEAQARDQAAPPIGTPAQNESNNLLTTKQLPDQVNYSVRTIRQWKKEGLPSIGNGRGTRFERDKAVKWIDEHYRKNNCNGRGGASRIAITSRLQTPNYLEHK